MEPDPVIAAAKQRHAILWADLTERGYGLMEIIQGGEDGELSRQKFLTYLAVTVVPHLEAERRAIYTIARHAGVGPLTDSMDLDHRALMRQMEYIEKAPTPFDVALAVRGFLLLFALRMEKEEKILLPKLQDLGIDIAELLRGRTDIVDDSDQQ